MERLTPYVVKLTKTVERYVVVYAESPLGVADVAKAMCDSGKIQLGNDDDYMTEAVTIGEADEDVGNLDGYTFSFERVQDKP